MSRYIDQVEVMLPNGNWYKHFTEKPLFLSVYTDSKNNLTITTHEFADAEEWAKDIGNTTTYASGSWTRYFTLSKEWSE